MESIWDASASLVGWWEPGNGAVYDASYNRRAVVQRGGLYSWRSEHRGYLVEGWFRDRNGHAVAFVPGARGGPITPIPPIPPIPPVMPVPPIPPIMPIAPIMPVASSRWCSLSFDALLG